MTVIIKNTTITMMKIMMMMIGTLINIEKLMQNANDDQPHYDQNDNVDDGHDSDSIRCHRSWKWRKT